jgi:hypothetical protein
MIANVIHFYFLSTQLLIFWLKFTSAV